MDILTDLAGLVLVAAGAFGAGFEFRMIRSRFGHQVLTPAAGLFRTYVSVFAWGMVFVSNHWNNAAVTWALIGLGVVLTSAQGVLVLRSRERPAARG
ncbi:MAG TPA: hypothetical protein VK823_01570 [Streptosporangiaceae bacterium]|jgi:hypothetical protein|nr:hypothetical protein [Streptosporangiaceae bacterium]